VLRFLLHKEGLHYRTLKYFVTYPVVEKGVECNKGGTFLTGFVAPTTSMSVKIDHGFVVAAQAEDWKPGVQVVSDELMFYTLGLSVLLPVFRLRLVLQL